MWARIGRFIKRIPSQILIGLIVFYRKGISPLLSPSCLYIPTCSEYAIIAIQRYGFFKGSYLAFKRILRCRPGAPGGYDPVP